MHYISRNSHNSPTRYVLLFPTHTPRPPPKLQYEETEAQSDTGIYPRSHRRLRTEPETALCKGDTVELGISEVISESTLLLGRMGISAPATGNDSVTWSACGPGSRKMLEWGHCTSMLPTELSQGLRPEPWPSFLSPQLWKEFRNAAGFISCVSPWMCDSP